jgi:hypothetical protein
VFLFRPPYGGRNASVDSIARAHGLLQILWSVDSRDSLGADYAQIESNVISGMRPGAIVLMHENHGQTVRALFNVFAALKRKHLRAVGVPQLLTDDPPSAAQLRAGRQGCGLRSGATFSGASFRRSLRRQGGAGLDWGRGRSEAHRAPKPTAPTTEGEPPCTCPSRSPRPSTTRRSPA